ncbi:MAG TPA: hypothetical protein VMQ86_25555 [Bryobacteraceae bacterium]|jgi:hypothetical protein|nr:hypothetical protein [Bryobacteraceae bacterium]
MPDKRQTARSRTRWAAEDEETAAYLMTLLIKGEAVHIGQEIQFDRMAAGAKVASVRRLITAALVKRANELLAAKRKLEPAEDRGRDEGEAEAEL